MLLASFKVSWQTLNCYCKFWESLFSLLTLINCCYKVLLLSEQLFNWVLACSNWAFNLVISLSEKALRLSKSLVNWVFLTSIVCFSLSWVTNELIYYYRLTKDSFCLVKLAIWTSFWLTWFCNKLRFWSWASSWATFNLYCSYSYWHLSLWPSTLFLLWLQVFN